MRYIAAAYGLICLAVFFLYGIDKYRAIRGDWRISERRLLIFAIFGAPGALAGMLVFRHKIRKLKFILLVPLILIAELFLVIAVWGRLDF